MAWLIDRPSPYSRFFRVSEARIYIMFLHYCHNCALALESACLIEHIYAFISCTILPPAATATATVVVVAYKETTISRETHQWKLISTNLRFDYSLDLLCEHSISLLLLIMSCPKASGGASPICQWMQ